MNKNANTFGVNKKSLAMKLYGMLVDEDAVDLEEYGAERFVEQFDEVLRGYGLLWSRKSLT